MESPSARCTRLISTAASTGGRLNGVSGAQSGTKLPSAPTPSGWGRRRDEILAISASATAKQPSLSPFARSERGDGTGEPQGQRRIRRVQEHALGINRPGELDGAMRGRREAERPVIGLVAHQQHEAALATAERHLADFTHEQLAGAEAAIFRG